MTDSLVSQVLVADRQARSGYAIKNLGFDASSRAC